MRKPASADLPQNSASWPSGGSSSAQRLQVTARSVGCNERGSHELRPVPHAVSPSAVTRWTVPVLVRPRAPGVAGRAGMGRREGLAIGRPGRERRRSRSACSRSAGANRLSAEVGVLASVLSKSTQSPLRRTKGTVGGITRPTSIYRVKPVDRLPRKRCTLKVRSSTTGGALTIELKVHRPGYTHTPALGNRFGCVFIFPGKGAGQRDSYAP